MENDPLTGVPNLPKLELPNPVVVAVVLGVPKLVPKVVVVAPKVERGCPNMVVVMMAVTVVVVVCGGA